MKHFTIVIFSFLFPLILYTSILRYGRGVEPISFRNAYNFIVDRGSEINQDFTTQLVELYNNIKSLDWSYKSYDGEGGFFDEVGNFFRNVGNFFANVGNVVRCFILLLTTLVAYLLSFVVLIFNVLTYLFGAYEIAT